MPLELRFASPELRATCERRTAAERLLGETAARKLRARLADIRAAFDIRDVDLGRPSYSHRGRVTFFLSDTHRLVIASAVTPIPRQPDKQVDWAQVNIFEVVEIY
jgi:hypothetical protein